MEKNLLPSGYYQVLMIGFLIILETLKNLLLIILKIRIDQHIV